MTVRNAQPATLGSVVIGTRGSALAQWQTNYIADALKRVDPQLKIEIQIIRTTGDKDQTRSLADLGGLGVFTKEIENALLAHEIDLAVHSLKDLPTELGQGLMIGAITEREDARDCLISRHRIGLMQLPRGALVGTSSARRRAQILALRPDVQIVPLRGNVDTRLSKARTEEYDAIVIAAAGMIRLGRANEITEYFPVETILPDPGQGALAIEIRTDDRWLAELLAALDHAPTRAAVSAERAFLRALGGGCRLPIGTYAVAHPDRLWLEAVIASDEGEHIKRGHIEGDPADAEALGKELAQDLVGAMHSANTAISTPNLRVPNQLLGQESKANASPLRGRRILVTRARDQATVLADKIRALGGEPIEFPTIDFSPLEDFAELDSVLERTNDFDWVVFTSANGVDAVSERLRALGQEPRAWINPEHNGGSKSAPKIGAIGPATARAIEAIGLQVAFVPTKFLGEQVAVELPTKPGDRALLLRADIASDNLAQGLAKRGVVVTNVHAYRTILPVAEEVDTSRVDAVTFTSSSTVKNFVAMLSPFNSPLIGGNGSVAVFCIGPVTAETARTMGLRVDAVASEHTIDGLINAMVNHYQTK